MATTVRDADSNDAAEIRAVASAAWRDTYAGLLRPSTIEAFIEAAYSIETLERRITRHTFLVIEADGQIFAFANAVVGPESVNLAAIYALPTVRGQGAGTMLLEALRSRFPELPIRADVLSGNRKGEVFYERRGFLPRETLNDELFDEPVTERRWWLGTPPPDTAEPEALGHQRTEDQSST